MINTKQLITKQIKIVENIQLRNYLTEFMKLKKLENTTDIIEVKNKKFKSVLDI